MNELSKNKNGSPQIFSWVKFYENQNWAIKGPKSKDDLLIPEVVHWVETRSSSSGLSGDFVTVDSDADKITKILNARFEVRSLDILEESLYDSGVKVNESLVEQILERFSNDWIAAFGFFKWAEKQMGYNHRPGFYDKMVDVLGKAKNYDLMWDLLETMDRMGVCISLETVSKVMRRLVKGDKWEDAIEVFRKLEQYGVSKNTSAMNVLIDALVKGHHIKHAQNVFLEFKDQIPPDSNTFNILVKGWCQASQLDKAGRTMEEMEKHGFRPGVVAYTSFIKDYCFRKDFEKVYNLLNEMQEKGCPPDVVTYTIVMNALGREKKIGAATCIYERMKKNGHASDASSYSCWIYILTRDGRVHDALKVLEDMPRKGVIPNVKAFNTLITAFCAQNEEETALKLLMTMECYRCKSDIETYAPLLKMCCKKNRMKLLFFLLDYMLKDDVSPECTTYSLLVHGLCKSGKLEEACFFFEDMVSRGMVRMDCTGIMLMEELSRSGLKNEMERIKKLTL
ncbi:Pentatricopeptide repeat [Dillenia turbinata]|uniref:Pentatricopeptide repeat n=1 Tax=Dillenia turbinata TaxID=194707 RepID=A0AAN8ZCI4_9MAGN